MDTIRDFLIYRLNQDGHSQIALALQSGKTETLTAREKMILVEASISAKAAMNSVNTVRLRNALVEVTTSGWGGESDSTEPGLIQPLMNL